MASKKDHKEKLTRRKRRKRAVRRKVFGSAAKPRMSVFRSHKNIYCQLIDDFSGRTLASASTQMKDASSELQAGGGNCDAAKIVGKTIAEKALAQGIKVVQFDRNGYRFHGRVRALADAAREGGLKL